MELDTHASCCLYTSFLPVALDFMFEEREDRCTDETSLLTGLAGTVVWFSDGRRSNAVSYAQKWMAKICGDTYDTIPSTC